MTAEHAWLQHIGMRVSAELFEHRALGRGIGVAILLYVLVYDIHCFGCRIVCRESFSKENELLNVLRTLPYMNLKDETVTFFTEGYDSFINTKRS
jgi:hypothetical protein